VLTQVNPAEAVWHLGEASLLESPRHFADVGTQQLPLPPSATRDSRDPGRHWIGPFGELADPRVLAGAGFSRFRRVSKTPFNIVFEARP